MSEWNSLQKERYTITYTGCRTVSTVVLDESIDAVIEDKLEGRGINTLRPEPGISDQEVLQFAISEDAPVLTRDQGDFIELDTQMDHPGILIDKQMHLRDKRLVAETVSNLLTEHGDKLEENVAFISNFYGRF